MVLDEISVAVANIEQGNTEKGIQQLRSVRHRATSEEKYEIATLLQNYGMVQDAIEIIEELCALFPDEGELSVFLAELYIDAGEEEKAIDLLLTIDTDDEVYLQALLLTADLYQLQGLDEVAEQKLLEAKRMAPKEELIDFGMGEFYLSRGDYKKSIPYFENVLKVKEKIGDRNVHLAIAEALTVCGKFEEAIEHYQKGLSDRMEINALFGFAITAYQAERYDLAIIKFNELIDLDPSYTTAFPYLAKAYEQDGALETSYETLKKGLKYDEFNKEMLFAAGKLALKLQKNGEAESLLRDAIALDPGYLDAIRTLSSYFIQEERYEEIIELLNETVKYGERDPQLDWDLGIAKRKIEEYSEALNHYVDAYNNLKDNIEFLEDYGFFLLEEGKQDKVREIFKRILMLDPTRLEIEEELMRLEEW